MLNVSLDDIMSEHPVKVKENCEVGKVAHLLFRYRINGILVMKDNDEEEMLGIFTTTDLLRLMDEALSVGTHKIEALERVAKRPVGEIAHRDVIFFQKNTKVTKVIAVMHKKNIHTIPVYDGDKLVGVVGRHDIINMALND